jgi:hypothetical protein
MLAGSLREFSLADVFQLLTLTKKSGTLRVSSPESEGQVHFRGGEVYFATSDASRLPLGARLVAAGALDGDTLRQLLSDQRGQDPLHITKALMDAGAVEEGTLDAFLREQIQDAVFILVSREEGSFKFESVDDPEIVLTVGVATEQLVEETSRRQGEWANVREVVPSLTAIVAMAPQPAEAEVSLSAQEWGLLTLVDGQRSVKDLVELTGAGEYATCTVLAKLAKAGLVEIVDSPLDTALAQLIAAREALREFEQVGGPAPQARDPEPEPEPEIALEELEPVVVDEPEPEPELEEPQPEPELQELEQVVVDEPQPEPEPEPETDSPPESEAQRESAAVDRAQVARELAALGLDEELGVSVRPSRPTEAATKSNGTPAKQDAPASQLTRDEDINKGLLLRLIDGVKGA